jgi:glycerophosphoryl diester phosphodiesterase
MKKGLFSQACLLAGALLSVAAAPLPGGRTAYLHLSHVHRGGGSLERPDNTLETFKWCWRNGSALECDCRQTKDGVGIMLHDNTLRRTARGISKEMAKRKVSQELTWAEIRDIDVGSYLKPEFAHHRIPTIDETFAAMKADPTYLCFVDEKGAGPAMIAEKARAAGVVEQVYYTGPSYRKAREWCARVPGGKTLLWIGTWPRPTPAHTAEDAARFEAHYEKVMAEVRAGAFADVSAVSLHSYYNPAAAEPFIPRAAYLKKLVDEFHAHGIPVCSTPFTGGETEEVYFKLFDLGFDGFSTDYPSVMFSVIRKLKAGARNAAK